MLSAFAARTSRRIFLCPCEDSISGNPLTPQQVAAVAAMDPKDCGDVLDMLEIVVGMPCMITANIATTLGVANGSRGIVTGICVHPEDQHLLASNNVRANVFSFFVCQADIYSVSDAGKTQSSSVLCFVQAGSA